MWLKNRWPPTQEGQLKNLKALRDRKYKKTGLLIRRARKVGQIRAYEQVLHLTNQEIERELKDLALIEQEIKTLSE